MVALYYQNDSSLALCWVSKQIFETYMQLTIKKSVVLSL